MLNREIINWYEFNKRDLPWRNTFNPYHIWISEIMLQQTQVATVIDYYQRFINSFPTVKDLAEAKEQEVLNHWQGLGYYSRARNLHQAAKTIVENYNNEFPSSFEDILSLKGIGVYTASAIAAFAFGLPKAAVDGNVYRVLSRLFGVYELTDSPKGKKTFQALADELMADAEPYSYNQAIIEFGALQCTAKQPKCELCPLQAHCFAYLNKEQQALPMKKKKNKVKNRYFYYLYIYDEDYFLLQQRGDDDIWRKMFEFPLIETNNKIELVNLMRTEIWRSLFTDVKIDIKGQLETKVHKLSHQNLYIEFIKVQVDNINDKFASLKCVNRHEYIDYPLPKPIELYLAKC